MNNEVIEVNSLDSVMKVDELTVNLDLFEAIFDNMKVEEASTLKCKKSYFLFIFEQILLSSWSISELEANDFISLIKSRTFLDSYIEIVTNLSYKTENLNFTVLDWDKISRKNNPLFKLWDLEAKLNTFIIKSRLNDSLNNKSEFASLDWETFVKINNEDFKIKENIEGYFILINIENWTSWLFKKVWTWYEKLVDWYKDIEFDFVWENKFARLKWWKTNTLFDLEKWEVVILFDKILSYTNIWNRLLVNYIFDWNNVIYDITHNDELFLYSNAYYDLKISEVISDRFLILEDKNDWLALFDIKRKKCIKRNIEEFHIDKYWFFHYKVDNEFMLYDLDKAEEIAYSFISYCEVIEIGGVLYIKFIDIRWDWLTNIKTWKKIFEKTKLKMHNFWSKVYIEFRDKDWFWICEVLPEDFLIILEGKKELNVDEETWKVRYKDNWFLKLYKELSL